MKKKLSCKTVLALMMAAIMFCLPVGGLFMGTGSVLTVFASDGDVEETESVETEEPEATVSGNEVEVPECICEEKCCAHVIGNECKVCSEDYTKCEYINPQVKITISTEAGWYNDSAKVNVNVTDIAESGNFTIQTVQAKISQNGSWTDITEDMSIEISENCSIYVLVTDQKGKTYEKNRAMTCFDKEKPTLNAAVSDGLLSIKAHDTDSGIKVIYVNGYEFTDFTNGTLNIRLQQFDAGYQYFTIQAMDYAGNMSEVYKTANPYYTDPEAESDGSEENPAEQLPVDAGATKPTNATANVTEHIKVDSNGNEVKETTEKADSEASDGESTDTEGEEEAERGKEFYTIQTRTDKVFYLVIDRDGEEEVVYFLTEISENDLLNVTTDNSETLPKNSAALESAIPVTESALPNNNGEQTDTEEPVEELPEDGENADTEEPGTEGEGEAPAQTSNPMTTYIIIGVIAVLGIGGGYYFKVVKGKKEQFIDEDEDEEEEIYEEEENEDSEDDFFDQTDDEEVE